MNNKPPLKTDAIIFALSDVLLDVHMSYQEVVRKTVQIYLEQAIGLPGSQEPLLTQEEVILLHRVGNFSSYQDVATAFIIYFVEQLPPVPTPTFPSRFHVPAIIAYLQMAGGRLRISIDSLREEKYIAQFAQNVAAAGGGLEGAHAALPKMNRHLLVSSGPITKANLAGRIFKELYLGAKLFSEIYEEPPLITQDQTGYIDQETLLINPEVLNQLDQKASLGLIATRSRRETEYTLQAKEIRDFFQTLITLDEVQEAGAKPIPTPWPLLEAASRLKPTPTQNAHIGANISNIQAAKAANRMVPFAAIGCLTGSHNKEAMRQAFIKNKADFILEHPDQLPEIIA